MPGEKKDYTTNSKERIDRLTDSISFFYKMDNFQPSNVYHRHNGYEIIFFISGNVNFYIEQKCIHPEKGSIILINPSEMHRVQLIDDTPYERFIINLGLSYFDASIPQKLTQCFYLNSEDANIRTLSATEYQEYTYLTKGLESSRSLECFDPETVQNAYALLILEFLNRLFRSSTSTYHNILPQYISDTMQYIEIHLCDDLSLNILAEKVHVSSSYLSTQFKNHTGLSLRQFILEKKLEQAKKLLYSGNSVTEACFLSGFNDYANFLRTFKNYTGITPGKYRKST